MTLYRRLRTIPFGAVVAMISTYAVASFSDLKVGARFHAPATITVQHPVGASHDPCVLFVGAELKVDRNLGEGRLSVKVLWNPNGPLFSPANEYYFPCGKNVTFETTQAEISPYEARFRSVVSTMESERRAFLTRLRLRRPVILTSTSLELEDGAGPTYFNDANDFRFEPPCKTEIGGKVENLASSGEDPGIAEGTYIASGESSRDVDRSEGPSWVLANVISDGGPAKLWFYNTPWKRGRIDRYGWAVCRSGLRVRLSREQVMSNDADQARAEALRTAVARILSGKGSAVTVASYYGPPLKVNVGRRLHSAGPPAVARPRLRGVLRGPQADETVILVNSEPVSRPVPCFVVADLDKPRPEYAEKRCTRAYRYGDVCTFHLNGENEIEIKGAYSQTQALVEYHVPKAHVYGNRYKPGATGLVEPQMECPDGARAILTADQLRIYSVGQSGASD